MRRFVLLTLALAATLFPASADQETCSETFVEQPVVSAGPQSPDLYRFDPVVVCEHVLPAVTHTLITRWDPNSVGTLEVVVTEENGVRLLSVRCGLAPIGNCGLESQIVVTHWEHFAATRLDRRTSTTFFWDGPVTVRMTVSRSRLAGECAASTCAMAWLRSGYVDLDIQ